MRGDKLENLFPEFVTPHLLRGPLFYSIFIMRSPPLLSIREATISFAKKTLFENLHLNLFPRDRICLIGKNGVGKTSLMNAIARPNSPVFIA